ncbi:Uu.00g067930.m01.CDS01 [Anthostomella pinea]|uniref:Uu.00g067930.m01.CDS01 n=1 Tax=Anthostomella pinea TaxID=933095 RepID=A0AAI8VU86_9PEZI|nr:Uu.00g067930.m01.CDS01 [Anthostomella pinea]
MAPLAALMNDGTLGDYFAGIWTKNLRFCLAWHRVNSLLTAPKTYRAPSFSWASVDGQIGSSILHLSETLMQDQALDASWIDEFGPRLLEQHMVLKDPSQPYGEVKEGLHLVLEACLVGLAKGLTVIRDHDIFHPTIVLDQSDAFDCPYCNPTQSTDEGRREATRELDNSIEHHVCMIVQGDGWKGRESVCEFLILRHMGEEGSYVRVGFGMPSLGHGYQAVWENEDKGFNAEPVRKLFGGMGWERRQIKLL